MNKHHVNDEQECTNKTNFAVAIETGNPLQPDFGDKAVNEDILNEICCQINSNPIILENIEAGGVNLICNENIRTPYKRIAMEQSILHSSKKFVKRRSGAMDPKTIGLVENDIVELVKCYIQDKRNRVNGKFRLVSYQVRRLSEEPVGYLGDHYLLDVNLREKMVHYSPEEEEKYAEEEYISFFVKVIPDNVPKLADYIKKMGCFRKEILLYKHVIPRLQDVMIGTRPFVPTAYFTKGDRMIVFENLKSEGYSIVENTKNLLDFDHLKVALQAVAKLHASSLILEDRSKTPIPKLFVGYLNENAYVDDDDHVRKINLENAIQVLCEMIKRIDKYARSERLEEILHKVRDIIRKIYDFSTPSTVFRNVLNHGDLWCNNVMFRYEMIPTSVDTCINTEGRKDTSDREDPAVDGKDADVANKQLFVSNGERRGRKRSSIKKPNPCEVLNLGNWSAPCASRPSSCILIDFQIARYAPPAYDILSLLTSTTTREFRRRYLKELLDVYYNALQSELDWFQRDVREVFSNGLASYRDSCDQYQLAGLIDSILYRHVTMLPMELVARCREEHRLPGTVGSQYNCAKMDICIEAWLQYDEYRNFMMDLLSDLVDQYILQA
uniref:CHK domain-containing protein n=1 Tax=Anopheles epiroticus TaxID=199890 RepID=A0A182PJ86_9DIPT